MTRKNRTLTWLNIFLLVINLSAFVAFLMMNHETEEVIDDRYSTDDLMRDELRLTEEQFHQVSSLNHNVFRAYQAFMDIKCELNFALIDELSSENPSKETMDSLANRIGTFEAQMKKQTVKHILNIRSICTEEQEMLLDQFLKEMMDAGDNCKYCNKRNCNRRDQLQQKK